MAVFTTVRLSGNTIGVTARAEDGREATVSLTTDNGPARDRERMLSMITGQIAKRSGHYTFLEPDIFVDGEVPFMTSAFLNGIRRDIAAALDGMPVKANPLMMGTVTRASAPKELSYKANVANSIDRAIYSQRGTEKMEDAYEISHRPGAELMRSKYCVRYELGMCPKQGKNKPEPLYLLNAGKRLRLDFHCAECEMTVTAEP